MGYGPAMDSVLVREVPPSSKLLVDEDAGALASVKTIVGFSEDEIGVVGVDGDGELGTIEMAGFGGSRFCIVGEGGGEVSDFRNVLDFPVVLFE